MSLTRVIPQRPHRLELDLAQNRRQGLSLSIRYHVPSPQDARSQAIRHGHIQESAPGCGPVATLILLFRGLSFTAVLVYFRVWMSPSECSGSLFKVASVPLGLAPIFFFNHLHVFQSNKMLQACFGPRPGNQPFLHHRAPVPVGGYFISSLCEGCFCL